MTMGDPVPFTSLKVVNPDGTERPVTKEEVADWIARGMPMEQKIGMSIVNPNCLAKVTIRTEDDWIPYEGEYEKQYYDLLCHDGTIHFSCWPNDGIFTICVGKTEGKAITADQIKSYRVGKHPLDQQTLPLEQSP